MNYELRMGGLIRLTLSCFLILFPLFWPERAYAHAFGTLYNLPVPFWLYLYGGVATILVSFLIIGYFFKKTGKNSPYPSYDLSRLTVFKFTTSDLFFWLLRILSVFLFFLTIICGFIGVDNPKLNFNMTFFWII